MLRTRVFALRVLERRETNITRPNSRRNFKQMRNGGNRCIDLTDLRQNFCAIRFRDWHNNGLVPVTGYRLPGLLQPTSSSDVSIASARNDGVRNRAQTNISSRRSSLSARGTRRFSRSTDHREAGPRRVAVSVGRSRARRDIAKQARAVRRPNPSRRPTRQ